MPVANDHTRIISKDKNKTGKGRMLAMGGLLERLETWVNEGTRSIKIEVNNFGGHVTRSIFVYDSETGEGKMLESLDDLESVDFFQAKKDRELELLEQLKAKYGKEGQA